MCTLLQCHSYTCVLCADLVLSELWCTTDVECAIFGRCIILAAAASYQSRILVSVVEQVVAFSSQFVGKVFGDIWQD